jgi:ketosteroid isomerase-like protein
MSRENVEIVRRFHAPLEGENMVPGVREAVERLGSDPQTEAVVAAWTEDSALRHLHPEIEWDWSAMTGPVLRGAKELHAGWTDWGQAWESYVFRAAEYRDLGDWVLARIEVQAQGREGIPLEMRTFELYRVRDGKVAVWRSFSSEREALEAAGLSE